MTSRRRKNSLCSSEKNSPCDARVRLVSDLFRRGGMQTRPKLFPPRKAKCRQVWKTHRSKIKPFSTLKTGSKRKQEKARWVAVAPTLRSQQPEMPSAGRFSRAFSGFANNAFGWVAITIFLKRWVPKRQKTLFDRVLWVAVLPTRYSIKIISSLTLYR